MIERAPAKVNLFLHITGRRTDGYHLIDSLAVFPGAADRLYGEAATGLSLDISGPFAAGLADEPDNLILRAARALAAEAGLRAAGARLRLEKHLPIASGIGGGSADAAAALRALSRIWDVSLPAEAMRKLAARLGADIPVCLRSVPQRMGGIGEILTPAPRLPKFSMVLVNPGATVATAQVFATRSGGYAPPADLPDAWPDIHTMARDLARLTNDLEQPAKTICPIIAEVLAALAAQPGCVLARMSGSGATCFGLFADPVQAGEATRRLRGRGWWCSDHADATAAGHGTPIEGSSIF